MRASFVTLAASGLLLLCVMAWLRSYLPEHATVRLHRGSLYLVFYDQQRAYAIDPANHPSQHQGVTSRWATEQILFSARRRAEDPEVLSLAWGAAGFEFLAIGPRSDWYYFILGAPFWALCIPPAVAAAWGAAAWRRDRLWRAAGRCRTCGYDLRGSAGACPECGAGGTPVESAAR